MRILVKIGGAHLNDASPIAQAVGAARAVGHQILLVHGGGDQLRDWSQQLGRDDQYVQGLRVTDRKTARLVTAVLGGEVNCEMVKTFCAQGIPAVGLTGADANLFSAEPRQSPRGLGFVGEISSVRPELLETLLAADMTPLIASIAPRIGASEEPFYNINADEVVGPLAQAIGAQAILFLTAVEGVKNADGQTIKTLDQDQARDLTEAGVIEGGMLPKTRAGFAALDACPDALVKIAPAMGPESILAALGEETGTSFVSCKDSTQSLPTPALGTPS